MRASPAKELKQLYCFLYFVVVLPGDQMYFLSLKDVDCFAKKPKFFSLCACGESIKFQTSMPSLGIRLGTPSARLSEIPHLDDSSVWKCVALGSVCNHMAPESQVSEIINYRAIDSRRSSPLSSKPVGEVKESEKL